MYLYIIKWMKATSEIWGNKYTVHVFVCYKTDKGYKCVMSGVRNINGHSKRPWVSKANIPGHNDSIIPFTFIKIYVLRMR